MWIRRVAVAALTALSMAPVDERRMSPNQAMYAVIEEGQRVGKEGEERNRLVVYTADGAQVAVAHIWLIEPDGTRRIGIRGCEDWGWLDDTRLFCQGTINPSTAIYLVFDAQTGRELEELDGSDFVWSPDLKRLANFGNVPHFMEVENKSDFLVIEGRPAYPNADDREQHWFRSLPVWAPDSQAVAIVDHRRRQNTLVLMIATVTGKVSEYQLGWTVELEQWPPLRDFDLSWDGTRIVVDHASGRQAVNVPQLIK